MEYINGDITQIAEGVIVHQVNCQGAIGAGLSGQLIAKYPQLERDYYERCEGENPEELMGTMLQTIINDKLAIVSVFAQLNYGNAYKTHKVYTDMDVLVQDLKFLCTVYPEDKFYIPYRIGCGLAGGNWEELERRIKRLPLIVVKY